MFVKQTSTLALLSTSDRAITLPAKRWTPPVTGQLIVWRDVCLAVDTVARTTAPSARGHCPIQNHGRVLRHSGAFYLPGLHQSNRALVLTVAPDFRRLGPPAVVRRRVNSLRLCVIFRLTARMSRTDRKPWRRSPATSVRASCCWWRDPKPR